MAVNGCFRAEKQNVVRRAKIFLRKTLAGTSLRHQASSRKLEEARIEVDYIAMRLMMAKLLSGARKRKTRMMVIRDRKILKTAPGKFGMASGGL